jgi:hypothetical protein
MPDTSQTNPFTPARQVTERHAMVIALEAPPNAGKTYSGCRLAKGAADAQGKRFAVIDNEGGRTLHLDNYFDFDHRFMSPPHRPEKYLEYARDAQAWGYGAVLIDSFSNVWRGIGGVLHWADEEMEAILARRKATAERFNRAFDEGFEREKNRSNAFIRPKTAFKFMMAGMLDLRIPIILSVRGETTYDPGEKKEMFKVHMNKSIGFDVTCRFRLMPDRKGVIDITDSEKFKMEGDHAAIFRNGEQLSEKHGAALEAWSRNAAFALEPGSAGSRPAQSGGQAEKVVEGLIAAANKAIDETSLLNAHAGETEKKQLDWLKTKRPELYKKVNDAVAAKLASLQGGGASQDQSAGEQQQGGLAL